MNNLSLLLYLAEAIDNLGSAMTVFSITGGISLFIAIFVHTAIMRDNARYNNKDRETGETRYDKDYLKAKVWVEKLTRWVWLPVLLFFVSMLMPSRDTIYMIAVSEVGEQAIQTPEFTKMRKLLNQYLDEQLTDEETEQ